MEPIQYAFLFLTLFSLYQLSKTELNWTLNSSNLLDNDLRIISNLDIYYSKSNHIMNKNSEFYFSNTYFIYSLIISIYMYSINNFQYQNILSVFILINLFGYLFYYFFFLKEIEKAIDLNLDFKEYFKNAFKIYKTATLNTTNIKYSNLDKELKDLNSSSYNKYLEIHDKCFGKEYTALTENEYLENLVDMKAKIFSKINDQLIYGINFENEFIINSISIEENSFSKYLKEENYFYIRKFESFYIYSLLILLITFWGALK